VSKILSSEHFYVGIIQAGYILPWGGEGQTELYKFLNTNGWTWITVVSIYCLCL